MVLEEIANWKEMLGVFSNFQIFLSDFAIVLFLVPLIYSIFLIISYFISIYQLVTHRNGVWVLWLILIILLPLPFMWLLSITRSVQRKQTGWAISLILFSLLVLPFYIFSKGVGKKRIFGKKGFKKRR